ncbi:MAG TPA: tetratricopeptide repeat protein [Candidatus Angelobacter sp.]|nr:tetratricopeptide repeat protein [Candidatus Angelobacter sp.]
MLAVVLLFAGGAGARADFYDSARDPLTQQIESGTLSGDALATAYLKRGYLWMLSRNAEQSLADFNQAIAAAPKMVDAYELRAELFRATGRIDQAIDDASQAITLAPTSNAQPYFLRAEIWEQKGDYGKAVADYDAGLGRDPKVWAGRMQRGLALAKLGDDARALPALDEAIKTDPHTLRTEHHKECVRTQAQTTPNCKTVDRPISTDELMQRAYRSRGVILLNQGAYELAAADLDRAGYTDGAKVYLGLARMALGKCQAGYGAVRQGSDHDSVPLEEALAKHREFIMKTKCADYVFN